VPSGCHGQQANRLLPFIGRASNHEEGSESMNHHDEDELFGPVIYAYTRSDAIRDGVLVELTQAAEAGFKVPVAITSAAYAACIAWPEADPKLPSILWLREEMVLVAAIAEARAHRRRMTGGKVERPDRIDFIVETVQLREGKADQIQVALYMVIGGGDQGEPVGTIMLVGED
jgi:hypothetical protein